MRVGVTLALILAANMATADETTDAKAAQCEALGGIVDQIVVLRQEGKRENRAIRTLTKGKSAIDESLQPAVQFLAGWVYAMSENELTFEPGAKYAEACKAQ